MAQQTLEEAAEMHLNKDGFSVYNHYDTRPSFIAGAIWQQARMYSEENMIAFLDWSNSYNNEITTYRLSCTMKNKPFDSKVIFSMWFETLKNK
jgi:hypothetical protein